MNKTNKKIIGLLILISILFNLLPRINLAQESDISITFDEITNYQDNSFNFTNSYNFRSKSIYTNTYNATYTFTNDIIGNNPIGWSVIETGGTVNIFPSFLNHDKILELDDTSNTEVVSTLNEFELQDFGTIEMWILTTDTTDLSFVAISDDNLGGGVLIFISLDNFYQYDGITYQLIPNAPIPLDNQWYHYRIDFETGGGGYLGLGSNEYRFYLNNINLGVYDFRFVSEAFFQMKVETHTVDTNYKVYIDAIGFSWDLKLFESSQVGFTFQEFTIGTEFDNSLFPLYENMTYLKSGAGVIANIENTDSIDGKYISLIDPNNKNVAIENNFSAIHKTLIDFYSRISNADKLCQIQFSDGVNIALQLIIHNNKLNFFNGSLIPIYDISVDVWYNISFTINFITMKVSIYVDSNLIGHYFDLNPLTSYIRYFSIATDTFEVGVVWDIDSIRYYDVFRSSGQYIIGSNLIPYLDISQSIKEVDKFKFDFKDDLITLRDIDSKDISNWTILDTTDTFVDIQYGYPLDSNRRVGIASPGLSQEFFGIEKVFNKQADIINLSWNIEFNHFDVGAKNASVLLFNNDGNLITDIEFKAPNVRSNQITLFSGLGTNIDYVCNLYINFNDNISIFRFSTNTTFIGSIYIPILNSTSHTLGKVKFITSVQPPGLVIVYWLDNLGVYINGNSLISSVSNNNEFGYFEFFTNKTYFSFLHPLFTFNGIGNITFTILDDTSHLILRSIKIYSDITTFNTREKDYFFTSLVSFRLNFNNTFQYTSFKNTGVRAIQSEATLIPTFINSGVDSETSFFYVDSNNRLAFIHEADDTNVEFIQISFILFAPINTNDRTIIFQSNKNNIAKGFFQVGFNDDTSNILELPSFFSTTSAVLTQEKIVNQIIITITDDDINSLVGITTGYISNIVFGFGVNFNITVATLSLLLMLVPLLIILLPTMLIGLRLGKESIMPLFLLMSLLCAITEIIPIWLFFVIAISSSIFILRKKNEVV